MSNPGLNAIYSGGTATGLHLAPIGLGRHRHHMHHMHHMHHHPHHLHHLMHASGHMHHKRRHVHGRGFFDTIRKGINFARDNQLATKALNVANALGVTDRLASHPLGSLALRGLTMAQNQGFGHRRRVRRRHVHGRGFFDAIKKGINFARDNQLATKALNVANALGVTDRLASHPLGSLALRGLTMAQNQGFGRRRRVRRRAPRVMLIAAPHAGRRHRRPARHYY